MSYFKSFCKSVRKKVQAHLDKELADIQEEFEALPGSTSTSKKLPSLNHLPSKNKGFLSSSDLYVPLHFKQYISPDISSSDTRPAGILNITPPCGSNGVSYTLITDASESMETTMQHGMNWISRFEAANQAVEHFIQIKSSMEPGTHISVVQFASEAVCVGEGRVSEVKDTLIQNSKVRAVGGRTNMVEGFKRAVEVMDRFGAIANEIIFLTDGLNTGRDPMPIVRALKKQAVVLRTIGIGKSPFDVDDDLLRRMASDVDGERQYFFITDFEKLFKKFEEIASHPRAF